MEDRKLILLKLNGDAVGSLEYIEDYVEERTLTGIDEIRFTIYQKIRDYKGQEIENFAYNLIEGEMLIELDGEELFIITKPLEYVNEEGIAYKEIVAYSRQFELRNKLILGWQGEDRVIYDPSGQKDKEGIYFGLLNYLESITNWKVGYYNTDVIKRSKALSYDKTSILQAIHDSQKDFECVLRFNTLTQTIDILDIKQVGSDRGLYLSDENFITSLKKEINTEDIATRIYCYGRDDEDISRVNITGKPYVENFDFFKNTEYMSKGLIDALNIHQDKLDAEKEEWERLFTDLLAKEKEYSNQSSGIQLQEGQLDALEKDFDDEIENEAERNKIKKKIEDKEVILAKMRNKLADIDKEIRDLKFELGKISDRVTIESVLTGDHQKELNKFIKEDVYNNSSYGKYDLMKLYEEGKKVISRVSIPFVQFDVSVEDFTRMTATEDLAHLLRLGDIVHLENIIIDDYLQVRLIGMVKTEDDITLTFSSKESVFNQEIFLEDILANAEKTSKTVDFSRFNWDKATAVDNDFRTYIKNELNLAKQGLIKAEGQRPVLDDRGLWLYKEMDDGSISPEQIRAVNNIIAVTKDNWQTVDVAITPEGVMANKLVGDIILGTDLKVISNSGVVEILENLLTIRDNNGIPRVQLGEYNRGKYGLKLMDKTGRETILDEDGMLQMWQEGRADNVDSGYPLKINVYVPNNTRSIRQAILRFKPEKFRAYSKATDWEGATSKTSEDGGGVYDTTSWEETHITTSEDGGGVWDTTGWEDSHITTSEDGGEIYTTTDYDGEIDTTTYGGVEYEIKWVRARQGAGDNYPYADAWYRWVEGHNHGIDISGHTHKIDVDDHHHEFTIPGHDHRIDIDEHYHEFKIPGHDHKIDIDEHHHEFKIPGHDHKIVYGIYEDSDGGRTKVKINGVDRTTDLGGSYNGFYGSQENLDITRYLNKGRWNTIELTPQSLGRLDATVFVQAFVGYNE